MNKNSKLVTVVNTSNAMHAQMLRLALERAGIRVYVQNENIAAAHPHYAHMVGMDIQVAEADLERARRILREVENNQDGKDLPACPDCGSQNTGLAGLMHRWGLMVALSVIAMQVVPALARRFRCRDCGHRWAAPKD